MQRLRRSWQTWYGMAAALVSIQLLWQCRVARGEAAGLGAFTTSAATTLAATTSPEPTNTQEVRSYTRVKTVADDAPDITHLAVAKLDDDSHNDIIYSTASFDDEGDAFYWCKGNGDGTFQKPRRISSPEMSRRRRSTFVYSYNFAVMDMDGDDKVDIVYGNHDEETLVWIKNLGDGEFERTHTKVFSVDVHEAKYPPTAFAVGDINDDGRLDFVTASRASEGGGEKLRWWRNQANSNEWSGETVDPNPGAVVYYNYSRSAAIVDVNKDGFMDVVSTDAIDRFELEDPKQSSVRLHLQFPNGQGGQVWRQQKLESHVDETSFVHVIEVPGGNAPPLVFTTCQYDGSIRQYSFTIMPNKYVEVQVSILATIEGARSIHSADLDGDGDIDLLVAATMATDERSSGLEKKDQIGFTEPVQGVETAKGRVVWFENNAGKDAVPNFLPARDVYDPADQDALGLNPRWATTADIDSDGQLEIVVATDKKVMWFGLPTKPKPASVVNPDFAEITNQLRETENELQAVAELDGDVLNRTIATEFGDATVNVRRVSDIGNLVLEVAGGGSIRMPSSVPGVPTDVIVTVTTFPRELVDDRINLDSSVVEVYLSTVTDASATERIQVADLEEEIAIIIPVTVEGSGRRLEDEECKPASDACQYWDEATERWRSDGVRTVYVAPEEFATCLTSHLTPFGVVADTLMSTFSCANMLVFTSDGLELFFGREPVCGGAWFRHHAGWTYLGLVIATCLFIAVSIVMECQAWSSAMQGEWSLLIGSHLTTSKAAPSKEDANNIKSYSFDESEHVTVPSIPLRATKPKPASWCSNPLSRLYELCDTLVLAGKLHLHPKDVKVLVALVHGHVVESTEQRRKLFIQTMGAEAECMDDNDNWEAEVVDKSKPDVHKAYLNFERTLEMTRSDGWFVTFRYVFKSLSKLRNVFVFSIVSPYTVRVLFFTTSFWSAGFLVSFFFQASGSATQLESACSKAAIPILRTLFVGMIAGALSLSLALLFGLMADQRRFMLLAGEAQKSWTIRKWHLIDGLFRCGVVLYMTFCILFTGLFLAQVKDKDRHAYLLSFFAGVVQDNVCMPIVLTFIVTTIQECRKRSHKEDVQGKQEDSSDADADTVAMLDHVEEVKVVDEDCFQDKAELVSEHRVSSKSTNLDDDEADLATASSRFSVSKKSDQRSVTDHVDQTLEPAPEPVAEQTQEEDEVLDTPAVAHVIDDVAPLGVAAPRSSEERPSVVESATSSDMQRATSAQSHPGERRRRKVAKRRGRSKSRQRDRPSTEASLEEPLQGDEKAPTSEPRRRAGKKSGGAGVEPSIVGRSESVPPLLPKEEAATASAASTSFSRAPLGESTNSALWRQKLATHAREKAAQKRAALAGGTPPEDQPLGSAQVDSAQKRRPKERAAANTGIQGWY